MAGVVVGVHNTKGGVGKTVSTIILASFLAPRYKVLVVDLDPIASLTLACGLSPEDYLDQSMERALYREVPARELIVHAQGFRFDVIPASRTLGQAQNSAFPRYRAERPEQIIYALQEALDPLRPDYDFILIDTQPTQSTLTLMPLVAADFLLIPCSTDYYAVRALALSFRMLRSYIAEKNPELVILGVLPTMYDRRTRLSDRAYHTLQGLCTAWGINMFTEPVPYSVRYAETGQGKRPIMEMTKDEKILRPYENVAKWLEHVVSLKEGVRVGSQ